MKAPAVVLPLLLVAACNGSSRAGGVAKADYVRQAEAICTRTNAAVKAQKAPAAVDQVIPYVTALVDLADRATAQLAALRPPEADRAALRARVIAPLERQVAEGRAFVVRLREAEDRGGVTAMARLLDDPPTATRADLAWMRRYGFTQCVQAADAES